jgi:hypothetical protein
MIVKGYRKNLTEEDMWNIDESESCSYLTEQLEKEWNEKAQE